MTSASWSMMLVVAVNAILFHAMPRLSRPDILFAVTVSDAFAAGAGRRLVSRYRAIVWIGAAAALAIGLLLPALRPAPYGERGRGRGRQHDGRSGGVAVGAPDGARARRPTFRCARRLTRHARHVAAGWGAIRRRTVCHSAGNGAARVHVPGRGAGRSDASNRSACSVGRRPCRDDADDCGDDGTAVATDRCRRPGRGRGTTVPARKRPRPRSRRVPGCD